MIDGIIKGAGNSRYLKSVPNALTLYPTYEDMIAAMVAGTFPVDLNGINPDGWQQLGDKLGKAVLCSDSLLSALGLAATAPPTQAMEKLRQMIAATNTSLSSLSSALDQKVRVSVGSYTGGSATQMVYVPAGTKAVFAQTRNKSSGSAAFAMATQATGSSSTYFYLDGSVLRVSGFMSEVYHTYDYAAFY